jgi:hypothetical protein
MSFKPVIFLLAALLAACGTGATLPSALPVTEQVPGPARTTLVWLGTGTAFAWADGRWQRMPPHDYEFSVVQRRHVERWESVKVQHRRHPAYDGSAGARDQVNAFRVVFDVPATSSSPGSATVLSSFGDGTSRFDREFRQASLDFEARGVSSFAPFNRYRITQEYRYEAGELIETVELYKRSGSDQPFMKFEERATMFAAHRFAAPPDVR